MEFELLFIEEVVKSGYQGIDERLSSFWIAEMRPHWLLVEFLDQNVDKAIEDSRGVEEPPNHFLGGHVLGIDVVEHINAEVLVDGSVALLVL